MEQLNDQQILWQQVQLGDKKAFEQVFRQFYKPLCNYSCSVLKDLDEAEEVVQNLFYNLWQKRESITISSSIKSYLYRAAHNDCLNRLKHDKVRSQYAREVQYQNNSVTHGAEGAETRELKRRIEESLDVLPEQCGLVFRLNRFEQLTYAEIAQKLGISVKTVEAHMGKALRIMREQLKEFLSILIMIISSAF